VSEARPPGAGGDGGDEGYLTIQQAAELLGVSRFRMARLVRDQQLPIFERAVDKRVRWLRRADVQALLEPRPRAARAA
jgi:excisionase family DNA binding protein